MPTTPVIDRTAAREAIRTQADKDAQARGFTDRIDELDHDYEEWQKRAVLRYPQSTKEHHHDRYHI